MCTENHQTILHDDKLICYVLLCCLISTNSKLMENHYRYVSCALITSSSELCILIWEVDGNLVSASCHHLVML